MKLLESRFFRAPDEPRAWYAPILWWELRRIPYNAVVFVSMILGLIGFALTVDGWVDFISPPIFPMLIIFFLSNLFYTGGWIVEVILRVVFRYRGAKFASRALIAGISFSLFVAFLPALGGFIALISGKKIVSEYAKFTQVRPSITELVGEYELVGRGRSFLDNSSDSLRHPRLVFHENGTFDYIEIPMIGPDTWLSTHSQLRKHYNWRFGLPENYYHILEGVFLAGKGSWELDGPGNSGAYSTWLLQLTFQPPRGYPDSDDKPFFRTYPFRFDIQHDQAPHDLFYVMGSVDSMEGLIFRKVDSSP